MTVLTFGVEPQADVVDDDLVYELHQDAYNYRPSASFMAEWRAMSEAEKKIEWDRMIAALERNQREEKEREDRIAAEFEKNIQATIESGAGDRKTALRWMFQEYVTDYSMDLENAIYEQNLMFVGDYEKEIKEALKVAA